MVLQNLFNKTMFIFYWEDIEIKIRTDIEFNSLNDEEKLLYLNEGVEEYSRAYIQEWLEDCIYERDYEYLGLCSIREEFMEKFYPNKLEEINKSIKNKAWQDIQDEKVEKISEFIDLETGDFENCQKWELFFINQMYKNFYPEIEDSALSEQGVSTTH